MKLLIKKIKWQNFLSTGNQWTEIDLNASKTTLIVGKNGSGKSTLLDAICFVLFNKPFRNINKPQLINSITNKDCLVEVEFEINGYEFLVRRGIKPNIFEIHRNGELITQEADNRDYQDAFEKYILKINHKTFCQIVVLGSAIFQPFMGLPTPQRREVIEDLLNLQVFTIMNNLLKDKIYILDRNLVIQQTDKKILESEVNITEKHLHELKEHHIDAINAKKDEIKNITKEIEELTEKIVLFEEKADFYAEKIEKIGPKNKRKKSELIELQTQLRHKVQLFNKDMLFLMNHETCPTCKQSIGEEFKAKSIGVKKEEIAEVEEAIKKLDDIFKTIDKKLLEVNTYDVTLTGINQEKAQAESNKRFATSRIRDTNLEIDAMKEKASELDFVHLNEIKSKLDEAMKVLTDMTDDRTVMGYAVVLLKDTGIKSKIIKTYIPVINNLIAKYLAKLDFFVDFALDEQFKEIIKSRFRDEFSYASFSQGEKLRIDIALLLAWRAIARLRSSIHCNLLILDEIFDSSADIDGVESIVQILLTLSEENIFIISHKDQMFDKFERVLKFEKTKNFSRMTAV